jgi:hypothetical protein
MENNFNFVLPAQLEKSENGDWKIKGLASTQDLDLQGEVVIQKGIDLSPIDQKRAVLNWEHQKGAENIIGVLDGYSQGDQGLYIEGRLFKNHTRAKAVQEIMSSLSNEDSGRIGLSVEGAILERDQANPAIIKKCRINAVALTMNPVNPKTYAGLAKSMSADTQIEFDATESNEVTTPTVEIPTFTATQVIAIVEKALGVAAGYTKAPNTLTDGDAMATSDMKPEKLEKEEKPAEEKPKKKMKALTKNMYKSAMIGMLDQLQKLYPEVSKANLWVAIQERLRTTFPEVYSAQEEK